MRLRLSVFITLCSVASFSFADSQPNDPQPSDFQLETPQLKASQESASTWKPYPESLPKFDYSGNLLAKNWAVLSAGTQLAWPDSAHIEKMLHKYHQLSKQLIDLASQADSHPSLKPILTQNFQPLAQAVQQVWRMHYQGQFEQAYTLGMEPVSYTHLPQPTILLV